MTMREGVGMEGLAKEADEAWQRYLEVQPPPADAEPNASAREDFRLLYLTGRDDPKAVGRFLALCQRIVMETSPTGETPPWMRDAFAEAMGVVSAVANEAELPDGYDPLRVRLEDYIRDTVVRRGRGVEEYVDALQLRDPSGRSRENARRPLDEWSDLLDDADPLVEAGEVRSAAVALRDRIDGLLASRALSVSEVQGVQEALAAMARGSRPEPAFHAVVFDGLDADDSTKRARFRSAMTRSLVFTRVLGGMDADGRNDYVRAAAEREWLDAQQRDALLAALASGVAVPENKYWGTTEFVGRACVNLFAMALLTSDAFVGAVQRIAANRALARYDVLERTPPSGVRSPFARYRTSPLLRALVELDYVDHDDALDRIPVKSTTGLHPRVCRNHLTNETNPFKLERFAVGAERCGDRASSAARLLAGPVMATGMPLLADWAGRAGVLKGEMNWIRDGADRHKPTRRGLISQGKRSVARLETFSRFATLGEQGWREAAFYALDTSSCTDVEGLTWVLEALIDFRRLYERT